MQKARPAPLRGSQHDELKPTRSFQQSVGPTQDTPIRWSGLTPRAAWAILLAVIIWAVIGVLTVVFSLLIMGCAILLFLVDTRRRYAHWLATRWGRCVLACHPHCRLTVTGRQYIKPGTPSILIANHQSLLDIMALYCLRRQFKWVAKESLFRIPLVGWAMSLTGYIKLSRGQHGSIRQTYEQAKHWLSSGISVLFFPEGTRSRTGQLGPFKNGAFKLALETGVPVVPIVVTGTRTLLARGSWVFRGRSRVQIIVLPPIDPARYHHDGADRLRDDAHQLIRQTLQQLSVCA